MLDIIFDYDAQALAAPQSFRDGMEAAALMLERHVLDNITIYIAVGYGELNGTTLSSQNVSVGGPGPTTNGAGFDLSYTDLRAALAAHNTSATDQTVLDNLPVADNIEGENNFRIGNAQARALGLANATDATVDGGVAMGTNFTGNVLFAGALHEITHAMGRVASWLDVNWSVDLFRFNEDNSGNRVFAGNLPPPDVTHAYFSIDGGTTKLADFGFASDPGDFLNGGVQGTDPYNEIVGGRGLTMVDLIFLDALGFQVGNQAPTVTALVTAINEDGPTFFRDLLDGASDFETDTISVTNLDASVTTADNRVLSAGADYTLAGSTLSLTGSGIAKFNSLSAGHSDTAVFHFNTTDFLNASTANTLTLTVNGLNDLPVINVGSSVLAGSVNELAFTTGSLANDSSSGAIAFTDPDLDDLPTGSINAAAQTITWQDAGHDYTAELSPAQLALFQGAFTISAPLTNTNIGVINWDYAVVDHQLDFLGAGESITVTTPVIIDDHNGGTVSQDIVVTINGADDNPIAAPDSNGVAKNSSLSVSAANGVLSNDTDPDVHDQGNLFVSAISGGAVGAAVAGTYGSLILNADGSYGYTPYKGALPAKIVAQDVFTYTAADGHGGTGSSTLSIVVTSNNMEYLTGANTTLDGSHGLDLLDGSPGHDILIGGTGADILIGGDGNTMTGNTGPDTFLFRPNFGANVITDFNIHIDNIQFDKSIFVDLADILSHTADTAAGAVITDVGGDSITLNGVTLAQLQAHPPDFYLV